MPKPSETPEHPSEPRELASSDGDAKFRLLLESLPHIAFVIGTDGAAAHYNQRFIDYLGFRPGERVQDRAGLLHPADRPVLESARNAAIAEEREYVVEGRLRRRDGVYRWHLIHNKPVVRGGRIVEWLGTAVDIHDERYASEVLETAIGRRTVELEAQIRERRRAEAVLTEQEARYRSLYNRTPMALHSVDADARLIDVNDTWLEMFEATREQVIGRSPIEFMTPDSARRYADRSWPEMLGSGGQVRVVDYQFVSLSGRVFDGRLASRGDFDENGAFLRSWSAIADITAEKRQEQELRHAHRMEAVGQLTSGIAHDFNNLLTAIFGNLELLTRRLPPDDERLLSYVEGARAAATRGAKLTAQLLAFSRQQQIVPRPVDLNTVVEEMRPLLQSMASAPVTIELDCGTNLPLAFADRTQTELAILNLTLNARDAIPPGNAGRIIVGTRSVVCGPPISAEAPEPGPYVVVSITDTGRGIPGDVRGRIFEPFFTTKNSGRGAGLGLSQVLGVAKQLGGGVAVESTPGVGTSVSIFLPLADASRLAESADAGLPAPALRAAPANILLVDDDDEVRRVTGAMLRVAGYEVREADSGSEALAMFDALAGNADLLLADIAMPGMDGVALARTVRATWPRLPVLFLTGYADPGLIAEAAEMGEVLRKPFDALELEAAVGRALAPGTPVSAGSALA